MVARPSRLACHLLLCSANGDATIGANGGPKGAKGGNLMKAWLPRLSFVLAFLITAALAAWSLGGGMTTLLMGRHPMRDIPPVFTIVSYFPLLGLIPLCGLFAFLVRRPYPWGKLVCLFLVLPWMMFSLMSGMMFGSFAHVLGPMLGSLGMLIAAAVHQFGNPRFSGPPVVPGKPQS